VWRYRGTDSVRGRRCGGGWGCRGPPSSGPVTHPDVDADDAAETVLRAGLGGVALLLGLLEGGVAAAEDAAGLHGAEALDVLLRLAGAAVAVRLLEADGTGLGARGAARLGARGEAALRGAGGGAARGPGQATAARPGRERGLAAQGRAVLLLQLSVGHGRRLGQLPALFLEDLPRGRLVGLPPLLQVHHGTAEVGSLGDVPALELVVVDQLEELDHAPAVELEDLVEALVGMVLDQGPLPGERGAELDV